PLSPAKPAAPGRAAGAGPDRALPAELSSTPGTRGHVQPGRRQNAWPGGGGGGGPPQDAPRAWLRPRAVGENLFPTGHHRVLVQRAGPVARAHEEGNRGGGRCGPEHRRSGLLEDWADLRYEESPRRGAGSIPEGDCLRARGGGGAGIQEIPGYTLPAH